MCLTIHSSGALSICLHVYFISVSYQEPSLDKFMPGTFHSSLPGLNLPAFIFPSWGA